MRLVTLTFRVSSVKSCMSLHSGLDVAAPFAPMIWLYRELPLKAIRGGAGSNVFAVNFSYIGHIIGATYKYFKTRESVAGISVLLDLLLRDLDFGFCFA